MNSLGTVTRRGGQVNGTLVKFSPFLAPEGKRRAEDVGQSSERIGARLQEGGRGQARGRCALRVPDPAHPARPRDRGTSVRCAPAHPGPSGQGLRGVQVSALRIAGRTRYSDESGEDTTPPTCGRWAIRPARPGAESGACSSGRDRKRCLRRRSPRSRRCLR